MTRIFMQSDALVLVSFAAGCVMGAFIVPQSGLALSTLALFFGLLGLWNFHVTWEAS